MAGKSEGRVSGESARNDSASILPTTNQQAAEKPNAAESSLHPAFYVM